MEALTISRMFLSERFPSPFEENEFDIVMLIESN